MQRALTTAILVLAMMQLAPGDSSSTPVMVPARGDLQQALESARPGDTILLEPGATYTGNFSLPPRNSDDVRPVVLKTAGNDAVAPGQRMTPAAAANLAKLQSPNGSPALATRPGARFWRVELIEFLGNRDGSNDIVTLGDGSTAQNSLAGVPSDLILDRLYIHGDPRAGQKRGIALNSARTAISNSYISGIMAVGQDSQAIAGWNGPGDYVIENNYLEAAGENLLFGGSDPAIIGLTPTKIVVRGNVASKPLAWRQSGSNWQVKNLLELKNARDVLVERNVFERNWQAAQSGFAILITVRNQDGGCPWCQVEQVLVRQNLIRDVAAGVAITGIDNNHPSRQTDDVVFRDNVFDGIDRNAWGGNGYFLQLTDTPRDLTFDHNTVIQGASNGIAQIEGRVDGFVFTNNIIMHGDYGIIAANRGIGNDSITNNLPGSTITANVIAGGESRVYPPGNWFPSVDTLKKQFVNFASRDFHLVPGNDWIRAARDGRAVGADLSQIPRPPGSRPIPRP